MQVQVPVQRYVRIRGSFILPKVSAVSQEPFTIYVGENGQLTQRMCCSIMWPLPVYFFTSRFYPWVDEKDRQKENYFV